MSQRTELLVLSAVLLIAIGTALLMFAPAFDANASRAVAETVRASILEPVLLRVTHLGDVSLWIVVTMLLLWSGELEAGLALGATLVGTFVNPLLKATAAVPRPEVTALSPVRPGGYSFPSGHAQLAASVSTVVGAGRDLKPRVILFAIALVVAFSRVALGVHRFSDILAGLGVGLLVGGVAMAVARRWMVLTARARLLWLPVGPAFGTLALVFGPASFRSAAAAAAGLLVGACLPPLYGLRDIRLDFSWRRLLVRAGIGAAGTATLMIGYSVLGPGGKTLVAGLFGLWITCLAPAAFRAARAS